MPSGSFPSFLAGATYTAGLFASGEPLFAWKTGDTSRATNTVFSSDPDLQIANLTASASYLLVAYIKYEGGTAGSSDLKWQWTGPAGFSTSYVIMAQNTAAGASTAGDAKGNGGGNVQTSGAGNSWGIGMIGTLLMGSSAGTLAFQWAQNTSSATATIVHTGSVMALVRMA